MRIVIAGETYYPGSNGQAVFSIHLAEGLAQAGNQVMVIVPSDHFASSAEVVHGVCVQRRSSITWFTSVKPELYLTMPLDFGIGRLLDEFRPDVVHIQDHYIIARNVVRAMQAPHRRRIPLLGTNHFLPENVLPYVQKFLPFKPSFAIPILWKTMLQVYDQFDAITTPTETAASILRGQAIHVPVRAISCGVDTRHFQPRPEIDRTAIRLKYGLDPHLPLFIYVGRLDHEKRLDLLLQAFARLGREDARLVVGGKGADGAVLRALSHRLGIEHKTTFTGYIPHTDLPLLLDSADIFCMTSPEELQSIATLEAMACGKPILAANARALPELVVHGANGFLFRPNDAEDAAHWMACLMDEPARWQAMGNVSLQRVQSHSLENTITQYEAAYRALMPAPALARPNRPLEEAIRRPLPEEFDEPAQQPAELR